MYKFGTASSKILVNVHPDLNRIFEGVIKIIDCKALSGYRAESDQNRLFYEGRSKLKYPSSKHNSFPSEAVDMGPYPIDWENLHRFYYFAGIVKGVASTLGIKIRWGGDWDGDNDLNDQSFMDLVHFELVL